MVKGVSRQVIVIHSPDPKMFEQAIFILKDEAVGRHGVTDEALLREARGLLCSALPAKRRLRMYGPVWACAGALFTGVLWLLATLL